MTKDEAKLLERVERVLKSKECYAIRFRLENIGIQTFMYLYISQAIKEGRIRLKIGNGDHYDDRPNPHELTFSAVDVPARTIVHEATHAVIDATHKGKQIVRGANEVAAFLAESIYGLYTGETSGGYYPNYFVQALKGLAKQVHAFNSANASGLFTCPLQAVNNLKTMLASLPYSYGSSGTVDTMTGIGDGA